MQPEPELDACGCSPEETPPTPVAVTNPPSLPALAWRVGTQGRFLAAQKLRLAAHPPLRSLSTRESSDPSLALLDAWACVLDVITFHQERYAQEHYLRTATDRGSILALARSIGYELRPGVAASTHLAFTVDSVAGPTGIVRLDVGMKVQSVPGQDEVAQTFETIEAIEARPEWNLLPPRKGASCLPMRTGQEDVWLSGTSLGLTVGDALLFVGDERSEDPGSENWDFRRIRSLDTHPDLLPGSGRTRVFLDRPLGSFDPSSAPARTGAEVYALRQRAAIFGHLATDWKALPDLTKKAYLGMAEGDLLSPEQRAEWPDFTVFKRSGAGGDSGDYRLDLDQVYPKIVAGKGWIVLSAPDYQELFPIKTAVEAARAEFGLSAKTTRITLGAGENHDRFDDALRETNAYAQSELLPFAEAPLESPVSGNLIELETFLASDGQGRLLIFSGIDADSGTPVSELAEIRSLQAGTDGRTTLELTRSLTHSYQRATLLIHGNVVPATHGDSQREEILGSGDGSRPFQQFKLKQGPLTYVSSPLSASGVAAALEVRVDGVLWRQAASFHGAGPAERIYTLRHAEDGSVTVTFGDGRTGARLPTGIGNVLARYRVGIGLSAQVKAGTLTTLLSRPLGAKAVTNPLPAGGAADPETLADARTNAPLTVLTLYRIVSVRDHEDFARSFAGVGAARADLIWDGERQVVHLTAAASDGGPLDPRGETLNNLMLALDAARHAKHPVILSPHEPLSFGLVARVATDPLLIREPVIAAVFEALSTTFGYPARSFGQGVAASQILAAIQNVPGVVAVDLESIGFISDDGLLQEQNPHTQPNLPARLAHRSEDGELVGAELLLISAEHITLNDLVPAT